MNASSRLRIWYILLVAVSIVFIARLFYLQIIKHDYYRSQALGGQLKEYNIPPQRGSIKAYDGTRIVPIVLNENLYTLFADPKFIKSPEEYAAKLTAITGGDVQRYTELMGSKNTRYVVLAKKLSPQKHKKIDGLALKGIGTRETSYRTYPQGTLASQLLGFVNDDGQGTYGIEQALNVSLSGKPGLLKAITDANGVPLVASRDNIQLDPQAGRDVVLTVDIGMQKRLEEILKQGLDNARSASGSALILEADSGAIKAMTNWPTYNPAEYYKVDDAALFTNPAVSSPLEVGSVMKVLTAAAALDKGVINKDTTYFDPSFIKLDGGTITNVEEDGGPATHSLADILQLSLNTGAVWLLKQMGGGNVNEKARTTWYDYMVNHYQFGRKTGVEQGYEAAGSVPDPINGFGLTIQYANTAFGQGMSITPLQLGAALAGIVNDGIYWKPYLIDGYLDPVGKIIPNKPHAVRTQVVQPNVSDSIRSLMQYVVSKNALGGARTGYIIGGKTGTPQIAKPGGGYFENKYNGIYIGFVGGDRAQYVVIVRVNEPHVAGYAGRQAAQPIFIKIAHTLIDNFGVKPKTTP